MFATESNIFLPKISVFGFARARKPTKFFMLLYKASKANLNACGILSCERNLHNSFDFEFGMYRLFKNTENVTGFFENP